MSELNVSPGQVTRHDAFNCLNLILGYGQLLERDESLSPTHKEYVKEVVEAGRHMAVLLKTLLPSETDQKEGCHADLGDHR